MKNFDLKKYLAENKLLNEEETDEISAQEQIANALKIHFKTAYETGLEAQPEDGYSSFDKKYWKNNEADIINTLGNTKVNIGENIEEGKLVKEGNITITHNDVTGDSKSTVIDVSLIDDLINRLQPIVGNKTIEINNKMREDFIQTIVRRLTGYTDMGGGNVRINEVNELEADPTGEFQRRKEKFISPLRKSIVKVLDDAFIIATKNDQSEEELDRSLKTITDIIDNIVLSTVRNKKKYYKFD